MKSKDGEPDHIFEIADSLQLIIPKDVLLLQGGDRLYPEEAGEICWGKAPDLWFIIQIIR